MQMDFKCFNNATNIDLFRSEPVHAPNNRYMKNACNVPNVDVTEEFRDKCIKIQ